MTFNLWFENECVECNVGFFELLNWLAHLDFEEDVVVDIIAREAR